MVGRLGVSPEVANLGVLFYLDLSLIFLGQFNSRVCYLSSLYADCVPVPVTMLCYPPAMLVSRRPRRVACNSYDASLHHEACHEDGESLPVASF